ncbi:hypothetical protein [Actinomadura sp. 3N407]|uniref:hypothetical protein n=1 Tax=Actinomadura sp. 3N407 TaxID=3457423 RepID=UPI003FCD2A17
MIILATKDGFTVTEKNNFTEFHIEVGRLSHDEFIDVVKSSADVAAHHAPHHLWVSVDLLRRELNTKAHPERRSGLDGMLEYADSKGWLNEAGTHVSAHIVVPQ